MCYLDVENLIWVVHVKSLARVLSYKLYILNSVLLNKIYTRSIQHV